MAFDSKDTSVAGTQARTKLESMLAVRRGAALAARRSGSSSSSRIGVAAAVNVASVFSARSARAMPLFSNIARRSRCDATVPAASAQQVKKRKNERERRRIRVRNCVRSLSQADGFGHGALASTRRRRTLFFFSRLTPLRPSLPTSRTSTRKSSRSARPQRRVPPSTRRKTAAATPRR